MKLVTAEEMRNMDRAAMETYGVPGIVLMDQAAKAVADTVLRQENFPEGSTGKVVIYCGKGNNGGDGFGAARYLQAAGLEVTVYLLGTKVENLAGDAALEAQMLSRSGGVIKSILSSADLKLAEVKTMRADVIVDAMLGTGFKGELTGLIKEACRMLNSKDKLVVAVDVPTGIDADFGTGAEDAIRADITVTMALPKQGLFLYPGKEHVGELVLAGIGMPVRLLEETSSNTQLLEADDIISILPVRRPNAHKGDAGRVVLAAGSPGFTGAAAMASLAAVKAGAGLVTLTTPLSCRDILSIKLTEVMVHGLLEKMPGVLGGAAAGDILQWTAKADALALGPGLGTTESTQQVILQVLQQVEKPVVIDADALTALKGHMEILPQMGAPKVLTPHPGEMARITGIDIAIIDRERIRVASHYAKEWRAVVVLKGAPTVVALPDGRSFVNTTGCNAMATGGSGDVLTGIIAAYLAQGMGVGEAALAAVYLHGLAGEIASGGEPGLAASEIIHALPEARRRVYAGEGRQFCIYNTSLKVVK